MSVRNILDGTIKVGGEVMPVEPEIPANLQVTTLKASDYVTGGSIYATDSLTVGTSRGKNYYQHNYSNSNKCSSRKPHTGRQPSAYSTNC